MNTIHYGICALIIGLPAHAQKPDSDRPPGEDRRPGGLRGIADFVRMADKDGDRAVSKSEFVQLERVSKLPAEKQDELFNRLDKNGDGLIRSEEMARGPEDRDKRPFPGLDQMDLDKDGEVTFEEFSKSRFVQRIPEERRRHFFERLDQNGDGILSPKDRMKGRDGPPGPPRGPASKGGPLRSLDKNQDDAVDFSEFSKAPWLKDMGEDALEDRFEHLDKDGNLKLEGDELKGPQPEGDRPKERERRPLPDA